MELASKVPEDFKDCKGELDLKVLVVLRVLGCKDYKASRENLALKVFKASEV
jgi:hypothetical protein